MSLWESVYPWNYLLSAEVAIDFQRCPEPPPGPCWHQEWRFLSAVSASVESVLSFLPLLMGFLTPDSQQDQMMHALFTWPRLLFLKLEYHCCIVWGCFQAV